MRLLKRLAVLTYTVSVLALCAGCASISAFGANPRTVCAGDTVTVTWAAVGDVTIVASARPRTDVPHAPTPPRPVRHVARSARPPLVNENQKAMLLAGQHLLIHDQTRALREFPELDQLQS